MHSLGLTTSQANRVSPYCLLYRQYFSTMLAYNTPADYAPMMAL
ncbi:hypothetical protein IQ241_01865 [Romeria aff. gracilis LEGE 07310]|uniref:Uncharacterized protein n=1 Tax=Vasconcelosia minhoensis LEGE 07310 TaxID=915328 RepID=A0A8J7AIJ2_9CYAN|nr:hypothetical protein [Romeria aff. gracilis LEGE 07310]